ncbi:MAG: hypothetical protein OXC06_15230 [Acidimicrobiaceae bacterium]|nr:hypothetical protein [Acidimicrobiaceae bacterium]
MAEAVRSVEDRLGSVERRVSSIDQRLERVEGKQDAMQTSITSILAFQQAHSERVTCIMQRFDDLEKLIRESLNGHGS